MATPNRNRMLDDLPADDLTFIKSNAAIVELTSGFMLYDAGGDVTHVLFPLSGSVSFLIVSENGSTIEAGFVGSDGAVGTLFDPSTRMHFTRAKVIVNCTALRLPIERFDRLHASSADFRRLISRNNNAISERGQQLAACNLLHRLEARLCRWLLQILHSGSGPRIELTQDSLSQMLGVTRARLNEALKVLEQLGALAQPTRGIIQITNHEQLRRLSCECVAALKLVPA